MRNVKSDKLQQLVQIVVLMFETKALKKVVLSKPYSTDEKKSTLVPISVSGTRILQLETFSKDNKAYHRNIREEIDDELVKLFSGYAQLNIISTVGDIQYMISKSGKETIIGIKKVLDALESKDFEVFNEGHNKSKRYILTGDEEFLKYLGISDSSGRIRDRMQAKYRQINRFLEHIKSILDKLPENDINIYDLCCGKSYLSFAVYHYFKNVLNKNIEMICIDLKSDVIEYCSNVAARLNFHSMKFICGDIIEYNMELKPHLVISLHACDIATDIVLDKASENCADVILSTPCCHHELNKKLNCSSLNFVAKHSMLRQKMCDALTDALRLLKLESLGYKVEALELIDPEDTPKNIMLKAIKCKKCDKEKLSRLSEEYINTRKYLLGE